MVITISQIDVNSTKHTTFITKVARNLEMNCNVMGLSEAGSNFQQWMSAEILRGLHHITSHVEYEWITA